MKYNKFSAVQAAAAYLLRDSDPTFSQECLDNAVAIYKWANTHLGLLRDYSPEVRALTNVAVLADISFRSPRKLIILYKVCFVGKRIPTCFM